MKATLAEARQVAEGTGASTCEPVFLELDYSVSMAKGYWITVYRNVKDPSRLAQYAAIAGPAIEGNGGRILARAVAASTFESGASNQRTVVIEFESAARAIATYHGPAYQAAVRVLGDAADREVRILDGVS